MKLDGTWYNELKSVLELTAGPDGSLTGQYESLVGKAAGKYPLVGRYDVKPDPPFGPVLSFCVCWRNDKYPDTHSTTSWAGQYRSDSEDGEDILTTWILCEQTEPADDWKSTLVGKDVFSKKRP